MNSALKKSPEYADSIADSIANSVADTPNTSTGPLKNTQFTVKNSR